MLGWRQTEGRRSRGIAFEKMICLRARKIGSAVRDLGRRKQDLLIPVSLEVQRGSSIESGTSPPWYKSGYCLILVIMLSMYALTISD